MTLCSDNHDEVCYEGRYCPACELFQELTSREEDLVKLQRTHDELVEEFKDFQNSIPST
jgi:hypothetical protein